MALYFVMDVDTEFDCMQHISIFNAYRKRTNTHSIRNTGFTKGLPMLLDLFDKWDVTATFFIQEQRNETFSVSVRYPEVLDLIREKGHEVGLHVHVLDRSYPARKKEIASAYKKLKKMGFEVSSFRAGWHFTNENTIKALEECGIKYECSPWKNRCSGPMAYYDIPHSPYHPSYGNIRALGEAKILVIPITDYRLGIDLAYPFSLMKKGTEILMEKSKQIEVPVLIHLTIHSWNCVNSHNNSLNRNLIQKLNAYLFFVSSCSIDKICVKMFGRIWDSNNFLPYYLELPDLLKEYLPFTSPKKYLWPQKYILSKFLKIRYQVSEKIMNLTKHKAWCDHLYLSEICNACYHI